MYYDFYGNPCKAYDFYGIPLNDEDVPYGRLSMSGSDIVGKNGEKAELRGIGLHHILQYSNLHTLESLNCLKSYGVNLIRISVYLEDYIFANSDNQIAYGYISKPNETKAEIEKIVSICERLGLYVLLDWHIYYAGAINGSGLVGEKLDSVSYLHKAEAVEFFKYFANKYANSDIILFELANEPYAPGTDIVSFAKPIYAEIANAFENLPVIVCNGVYWYQSVTEQFTINGMPKVFSSMHMYGSEIGTRLTMIKDNVDSGIPMFITEWGNSTGSGDGQTYDQYAINALDYFHDAKIPASCWKFTDQSMTTAFLKNRGEINSEYYSKGFVASDLSHNGTLFLGKYKDTLVI